MWLSGRRLARHLSMKTIVLFGRLVPIAQHFKVNYLSCMECGNAYHNFFKMSQNFDFGR